ncbi:MAG: beta-glucosidase, partial [Methylocella sp.]
MPASKKPSPRHKPPAHLPDAALVDLVQRQTFRFFWEGAHPVCGLARDRSGLAMDPDDDLVGTGGSGFAVMAIIVAAERGWITRDEAANRLGVMLGFLERAPCYHGLFPHYMNGHTGAAIRFGRKDDGSDIVETSFLFQGLLCARQYFNADNPAEKNLR